MVTDPPLKRNETRHWFPNYYRVPFDMVIHAARRWTRDEKDFTLYMRGVSPRTLPDEIPLGKLVGVVRVVAFTRTENLDRTDLEETWGNYEAGRWAWVTDNMRPFKTPIPWVGRQGFFEVPDDVVERALHG